MKEKAKRPSFRIPPTMMEQIEQAAANRSMNVSEFIRLACNKELQIDNYENCLSQIIEVTEASLEKVIEPYMKRIIALIQKNGKLKLPPISCCSISF